jgi:hypothetical protein
MSAFLDPLDLELMRDPQGRPMLTRDGRQLWRVLTRFRYLSDVVAVYRKGAGIAEPDPAMPGLMDTPAGFVTDLCSKPQIALAFMGDNEQEESLPHDLAYSTHSIPRDVADRMLYEACILNGVPRLRAMAIYAGVRIGGGSHWEPDTATPAPQAA